STMLIFRVICGSFSSALSRFVQSSHSSSALFGEHPKLHPITTSMSGRSSANALTRLDFPVPLGPRISNPPIDGSTASESRVFLRSSRSTNPENGIKLMDSLLCVLHDPYHDYSKCEGSLSGSA